MKLVLHIPRKKDVSEQMFWCNFFKARSDTVIAACDQDILDKKLKSEKINFRVKKEFYGGKLVDEEAVVKLMGKATIGNLVGKNIVSLAEKNGFITRENIIFIDEVPHAQFAKL